MEDQSFIKALWDAATSLGLTSRWEFWLAVVAVVLLAAARKMGWILAPGSVLLPTDVKHVDLTETPPSDPIPTQGGTPTQSGSIPVPGPKPPPFEGQP